MRNLGRTVDEARKMAKDAISGYIASLRKPPFLPTTTLWSPRWT